MSVNPFAGKLEGDYDRWKVGAEDSTRRGLIIRLIIQTIRRDPSGSVWTDEAPNVSRPDPSGADQIVAEHQATDLAVD